MNQIIQNLKNLHSSHYNLWVPRVYEALDALKEYIYEAWA